MCWMVEENIPFLTTKCVCVFSTLFSGQHKASLFICARVFVGQDLCICDCTVNSERIPIHLKMYAASTIILSIGLKERALHNTAHWKDSLVLDDRGGVGLSKPPSTANQGARTECVCSCCQTDWYLTHAHTHTGSSEVQKRIPVLSSRAIEQHYHSS